MEVFKDIKDYEGYYQISTNGRVKSLSRTSKYGNFKGNSVDRKLSEKFLIPAIRAGYYFVVLSKNGEKNNFHIHRLVGKAFLKHDPKRNIINHKDGNKLNNNVNNLEWCTQKENRDHAIKTGLDNNYGEDSGSSILTEKDVYVIFMLLNNKVSHKKIAEKYNVDRSTITAIANRKTWKHLIVPDGFILVRKENGNSKLNEEAVVSIREMLQTGESLKNIADKHNVSIPTISNIRDRKIWGWV